MEFVSVASHYFFPSHRNDHKAKLLHSTTIGFIIFALFVYQLLLQTIPATGVNILGYAANIPPEKVVELTNQKRADAGVGALRHNDALANAAREKGEHMLANDYWAHVAPDGTEPWDFFVKSGYQYRYAGENLARDFSNPESAVEAWVSSPSHKENLLSSKYEEIGIAVVEGDMNGVDTTIIVQLFGTPLSSSSPGLAAAQTGNNQVAQVPTVVPTTVPTTQPTIAPSATPQPTPTAIELPVANEQIGQPASLADSQPVGRVLISPFETTRGVSLITIGLLLSIMIVDAVITWRRNTPRIAGRTFAHLAFLGMILAIVLIARAGQVL